MRALLGALLFALPLAFGGYVWQRFGSERGLEYLTGYLVEKSLSVDNLFVFMLLLGAFAPFVRGLGLSELGGKISIDVDIDGHIGDPIISGTFAVPGGAPPIKIAAADKAWALAIPRLDLRWAQDTLFAGGDLEISGQTLHFGEVGGQRTYYVLGGTCEGNFSLAAQGFLDARPLRDLLPDTISSSSGGLDVRTAHVAGLVDDPLQIHALRGTFVPEPATLSLLGLARETGLPYSVLHKLANNRAVRLDLGTMERLIRFFGVSGIGAILEYIPDERT